MIKGDQSFEFERRMSIKPDWTYEFISIDSHSDTPDILNFNLYLTRISRGQFAFSGTMDVGEDLNDDTLVNMMVYYSYSSHDYVRSPLQVPKLELPKFIQTHYKDIMMEDLQICAKNAPDLESDGVVTKRLAEFENCSISNENMPSHLKAGYYKIVLIFTGRANVSLTVVIKVEPKD
ncbi:uncharacterized protein LOC135958715 [Calliphora vicina]|uniref:uncharacterized protein LOC135958715 n=1 Tax=Calliphora vicina TaxID=7373 RepID=UPI00325A5521